MLEIIQLTLIKVLL